MVNTSDAARTVKRRGILAAAGAVVAGMVARAARDTPVSANDQTWTMPYNTSTSAPGSLFALTNTGGGSAINVSSTGYAGVLATSSAWNGVWGTTYATGTYAGVYGETDSGSAGVRGFSNSKFGVQGTSYGSAGVLGEIPATSSPNTVGVYGKNTSTGPNPMGIWGLCNAGTGIFGQTGATYQYGVLGTTTATNSIAIGGIANTNGSSAFSGGTTNPNAFAGFFQGTVVVQGNFAVTGNKAAAIRHPRTGDHRLVYCVESPDAWFEDFGKGQLVGGKAEVKLDADFAAIVHTDDYHVFLTPRDGANKGLAVIGQRPDGFVVQELHGGTSSGAFSWRVVAKRGDVKAERLGKFEMPNLPLPDVTKFKAPETPVPAAPPPRKP